MVQWFKNWRNKRVYEEAFKSGELSCGAKIVFTSGNDYRGVIKCPCLKNSKGYIISAQTANETNCAGLKDFVRVASELRSEGGLLDTKGKGIS